MRGIDPTNLSDAYIVNANGCWIWQRWLNKQGYGQLHINGVGHLASRAFYMLFGGPIPDGYFIDHLCRTPACVNPEHLEPVTPSENVLRGATPIDRNNYYARRTHCPRGHPYDEANTYRWSGKKGRQCRECMRVSNRRRRAAKKAAAQ